MNPIHHELIEKYAACHSTSEDPLLKELEQVTHEQTEWPQMLIGHVEGQFLRMLIEILQAKRVLDVGTFTGYSALAMAAGLPEDGELITCDRNEKTTRIAREFWDRSPHGKKIYLTLGDAIKTIPAQKGPFDFVFIDADKENYIRYWELCLPKVRKGGVIAVDNVLWGGRVLDPKDETDKTVAAFNKRILNDPRVEIVMLPVRDGITLARKK
ncbi:MAG: methyltransferase [Omnitrophica bacterium GWA2_52_8]|nr:MAG: methyltransferase [Omnitrophica bacterium GWA2_52_8]